MAVWYTFATSKTPKFVSVPCVGDSISLSELKDAIRAPLVANFKGKETNGEFDFRIYDIDSQEEFVGTSARVRKHASVLVKRVPAYVLLQQSHQSCIGVSSGGLKVVSKCPKNVVIDDGFGEDIYSRSSVNRVSSDKVETTRKEIGESSKNGKANVIDGGFREGFCPRPSSSVVNIEEVQEMRMSRNKEIVHEIPKELMCTLCKHIMKDPMLIPCCYISFCHNCIKVVLLGEKKCPNCESLRCNDTNLLSNQHLKSIIDVYIKSNPSALSSGSCSSLVTSTQFLADDLQPRTPHKIHSNQDVHVSKSIGSGLLGKKEPPPTSLNGSSKRTKVL